MNQNKRLILYSHENMQYIKKLFSEILNWYVQGAHIKRCDKKGTVNRAWQQAMP